MNATTFANRSIRHTSAAFRAVERPEPTHCLILNCPWGETEVAERGSLEEMQHEARIWNRERGYRATVKPLAAVKLAAAA